MQARLYEMDKKMQDQEVMMLAMGKAQEELLDDSNLELLNQLTLAIAKTLHNELDDTQKDENQNGDDQTSEKNKTKSDKFERIEEEKEDEK